MQQSLFPKNSLYGKRVIWIRLPQIYVALYLMNHSIIICEMFTKQFPFRENWQFGPNLVQYYETLHDIGAYFIEYVF